MLNSVMALSERIFAAKHRLIWFTPCLHVMLTPDTQLVTAVTAASLRWNWTARCCVSPCWNEPSLVSDDSPSLLDHNNFDFSGSGEGGGAKPSMKAMHQNAFAVLLITRRCLRNNRLDWISHPFFSTLIHLTVAWSHWQPNARDWRVKGGGAGQKRGEGKKSERKSLKEGSWDVKKWTADMGRLQMCLSRGGGGQSASSSLPFVSCPSHLVLQPLTLKNCIIVIFLTAAF